jgi:hypothetical protein
VETGTLHGTLDNIKWATDYFLKCIISDTEVVGQVGNGGQDHALWTRPEDIPGPVPVSFGAGSRAWGLCEAWTAMQAGRALNWRILCQWLQQVRCGVVSPPDDRLTCCRCRRRCLRRRTR